MLDQWKKFLLTEFFGSGILLSLFSADVGGDALVEDCARAISEQKISKTDFQKALALTDYAEFLRRIIAKESPGDIQAAEKKLFDAFENDPESPVLSNLIRSSLRTGQDEILLDLKLRRLEQIIHKHPDALNAAYICIPFYILRKMPEKAASILEGPVEILLKRDRKNPSRQLFSASLLLADLYAENGHFSKAEDLLKRIEKLPMVKGPERNLYLLCAMDILLKAEAKSTDERTFPLGYLTGSEKTVYREKWSDLRDDFLEEAFRNADESNLEQFSGQLANRRRVEKGVRKEPPSFLKKGLSEKTDALSIRKALAFEYMKTGDFQKAAEAWKKVLSMEEDPRARRFEQFLLAESFRRAGNLKEAVPAYEKVLTDFPKSETIPLILAACLYDTGKTNDAVRVLRKMNKSSDPARQLLFLSLYREKKYREALDVLKGMILSAMANKRILSRPLSIQGALAAEKVKDYAKMRLLLEPHLVRNGNDVEILNLLGYSLADGNKNLAYAEALLMRALSLEPKNMAILDSAAWLRYRQGRYSEAKKLILEALASAPHGVPPDPVILDHAGDIHLKCGNVSEARRFWKEALKEVSEELNLDSVRKKLSAHPEPIPEKKKSVPVKK